MKMMMYENQSQSNDDIRSVDFVYIWESNDYPNHFYGGQTKKPLYKRHGSGTYAVNNSDYCIRGQNVKVIWSAEIIFRMTREDYIKNDRSWSYVRKDGSIRTMPATGQFDSSGRDYFLNQHEQKTINAVYKLCREYREMGAEYCNRKDVSLKNGWTNECNMDAYSAIQSYLIEQRMPTWLDSRQQRIDNMIKKVKKVRDSFNQALLPLEV
jgi:hypothetical protein